MYHRDKHLHFIGIGGVGMAGIAEVLLNLGYSVSGSDLKKNALCEHLERLGAKVFLGHSAEHLPERTSFVVYSSAIPKENPEYELAKERGIPIIGRAEMLAELMRMKYGIAVGGSHGKTTTTSMIARMLIHAELDPTVIIGGRLLNQQTGASVGQGEYLVAEADESDGSFCLLRPSIAIVTNIDREHMSHYGTFGALEAAFSDFMKSVPFYGAVVACFDDPVVANLASKSHRRIISYGFSDSFDFSASEIEINAHTSEYTLSKGGEVCGRVHLHVPGVHMVRNSLAAIAVAFEVGVDIPDAIRGIETFPGVARRSEVVGEIAGVTVIDDYGHHPTEIRATLSAIREGRLRPQETGSGQKGGGRLRVLFEPHRYSRTKELFGEFLNSFAHADEVIIGEIYAASEEPIPGVSGEVLASAIQGTKSSFVSNLRDAVPALVKSLSPGDVVVTLGAGAVGTIAKEIVFEIERNRTGA